MVVTFTVSPRPHLPGDGAERAEPRGGDAVKITRALTTRGYASLTIGGSGAALATSEITALVDELLAAAAGAEWVVLCGPVPAKAPPDLYPRLVRLLQAAPVRVAVSTDWEGLGTLSDDQPDLVVLDLAEVERAAGYPVLEPWEALAAVEPLRDFGRTAVLACLHAEGAVLADGTGSYFASVSAPGTAGASRDRLLAGFLAAGGLGRGALVEGMAWAAGVDRAAVEHTWVDTLELTR
jgi:1-phosphofructokinase